LFLGCQTPTSDLDRFDHDLIRSTEELRNKERSAEDGRSDKNQDEAHLS
jgi:hypothetical protein